ncbi:MAG: hypothetical protein ACOCYP_08525 [Planctomycetota bacterium]
MPAPRVPKPHSDPRGTGMLRAHGVGTGGEDLTRRAGDPEREREWFHGHAEHPTTRRHHRRQAQRRRLATLVGAVVLGFLVLAVVVAAVLVSID